MIPPEPDPPEPVVTAFTYGTVTDFTIGSGFPAKFYTNIQLSGSACSVEATDLSDDTHLFTNLVVYTDSSQDTRYYFAEGSLSSWYGLLDNNFEIGQTNTVYSFQNGTQRSTTSMYINAAVPSDYVTIVRSGNFTLTQR